jgi:integrase
MGERFIDWNALMPAPPIDWDAPWMTEEQALEVLVLELEAECGTLPARATPKRAKRGPSMSRRSQVGSIEVSGKWYVVRHWKDAPGQERRIHACERICAVSGPGTLTKAERKRRALEIVMAAGVNDPRKFAETTCGLTFREQAELFTQQLARRKRRPLKPATLATWQSCLDRWLNPNLGDVLLTDVHNGALKALVAKMDAAGLSAKSIINYIGLAKMVVESAKDRNGEPLFPRKWDAEFMDLPIVQGQRQPKFTAEQVSSIVRSANGRERVLYALLAGTGLRIGEALALEIGKHVSPDCRTLHVRQSEYHGTIQQPKTPAAIRDVDLCPALADMLRGFIGDRRDGLLFSNGNGRVLSQTNLLRRKLHPLLKRLGIEKQGFHSFRRFRATFLRMSRVSDSLVRYWLGHSNKTITDEYTKLGEEADYRREAAASVGLGFKLPVVRTVRRKSTSVQTGVAA